MIGLQCMLQNEYALLFSTIAKVNNKAYYAPIKGGKPQSPSMKYRHLSVSVLNV